MPENSVRDLQDYVERARERGEAMDEARWELRRQIARTGDARARFLAAGDAQAVDDPLWLAFQRAACEELRRRREYCDTFGVPYDDEEVA